MIKNFFKKICREWADIWDDDWIVGIIVVFLTLIILGMSGTLLYAIILLCVLNPIPFGIVLLGFTFIIGLLWIMYKIGKTND